MLRHVVKCFEAKKKPLEIRYYRASSLKPIRRCEQWRTHLSNAFMFIRNVCRRHLSVAAKSHEQVELTKHNLRLLIFEDVLHYHPECRSLIFPGHATTMAAAASSSDGGQTTCPNSGRMPADASSQPPPPPESANLSATSNGSIATTITNNAGGGQPTSLSKARGNGTKRAAGEDEGLEAEPAWPPNEAAGPKAGLEAGPAAGAAGWTGDGTAEDAVTLSAVSVGGGGGVGNGLAGQGEVDVVPGDGLVTAL